MIETPMIDLPVDCSEETYRKHPGLSFSSMKDLQVSPLRFWFKHINPQLVAEPPTPAQLFGTAVHAKVLQPAVFDRQFVRELCAEDIEGCLVTMDDLRGWLRDKGQAPKGTRKNDLIEQVQRVDPAWPIFDVLQDSHGRAVAEGGLIELTADQWERVHGCAAALMDEPHMQRLLSEGEAEKVILDRDAETGVLLKSKQDWVAPKWTVDIKTFVQQRGKDIDSCVHDAIWYEGYYRQAQFYSRLRGWPKWDGDFVLAFVESEPPHEVRLKVLRGKTHGQPNVYWTTAELATRACIRRFAEYWKEFGEKPWRHAAELDPLIDDELKGLIF